MVEITQIRSDLTSEQVATQEYCCVANLNIYNGPNSDRLATQAAIGRHLRILPPSEQENPNFEGNFYQIQLCEDDYPGWLSISDLEHLEFADSAYQAIALSESDIHNRLPDAIAFTLKAMNQPNEYLWGGTIGPNYDCSGLIQAAFAAHQIWLPRDAYQQEAFTTPINLADLQPGDLIFFGSPEKATHVGLYLGENQYIHSSGQSQGRNGIGIDILSDTGDRVSQTYYRQLRGAGRIMTSYQPSGKSKNWL